MPLGVEGLLQRCRKETLAALNPFPHKAVVFIRTTTVPRFMMDGDAFGALKRLVAETFTC